VRVKVLLVDDERLALRQLVKMLQELTDIDIAGTSMDSVQAIEMATVLKPDVIFLDIHMPEMSGLQAAVMLQEVCPSVEIVFVTAFDEYAIQAFELQAIDYILKPVQRERLVKTIQRLRLRLSSSERQLPSAETVMIRCFPSIQIDPKHLGTEPIRWRTSKGQELFAYLLHHRGQLVRKSMLHEVLWPDLDIKKATSLLYTTIYQIRQSLKHAGIVIPIHSISVGEGYSLDAARVRLESEEWEQSLDALEEITEERFPEHQRVLDMYRGDYLSDYDYLWAESERQRLRMLWLHHAQQLAQAYSQRGLWNEAVQVYRRIQEDHPLVEDSYFALMKLYDRLQQRIAVEEQYQRLTQILKYELDIEPDELITRWYEQWKGFLTTSGF
jgi:two-component system LytT family response regulator